jgi:hypothetical protein
VAVLVATFGAAAQSGGSARPGQPEPDCRTFAAYDRQTNGLVRPEAVQAPSGLFDDQDLFDQWLEEECNAEPRKSNPGPGARSLVGSGYPPSARPWP